MGARENVQRLIERKKAEIAELEATLRDAKTYIDALTDALKALPKEQTANGGDEPTLRPGTMVYRVREILKAHQTPLHIGDILLELGRPVDKNNRVSVSGSLAAYVRNKQIFNRPKPNTFGLVEFESAQLSSEPPILNEEELPESFGQ
jgi:hypothetical protein